MMRSAAAAAAAAIAGMRSGTAAAALPVAVRAVAFAPPPPGALARMSPRAGTAPSSSMAGEGKGKWKGRGGAEAEAEADPAQTDGERRMAEDALAILAAAVDSVDPRAAVLGCLSAEGGEGGGKGGGIAVRDRGTAAAAAPRHVYEADEYDEVLVLAFGKASSAMALAAAEVASHAMPAARIRGVAVVKDGHATEAEARTLLDRYGIAVREASHPVPDGRSVRAAGEVLDLAEGATSRTLVVCCISGGGSALFCSPLPPLTLEDLAATNSSLLGSGMPINSMNVVRKRLERGKGGGLAAAAYPAPVLSLVLSDVVGDPLDLIASGPTVPDPSGFADAAGLVRTHGLGMGGGDELPPPVLALLERGEREEEGGATEQEPPLHPAFSAGTPSQTVLVGNNGIAVEAAATAAARMGYDAVVLGDSVEGEARDIAGVYVAAAARLARQRQAQGHGQRKERGGAASPGNFAAAGLPAALIAGGETTVTLGPGPAGRGGRNQEIGLAAALDLRERGLRDVVLASVGTDGTDGPTDAAGAVVDGGTVGRIEHNHGDGVRLTGEEAMRDHDAYTFFDVQEGDEETVALPLIRTGPTGTNVADVCVVLVK